jgi:hypothetical protein
MPETMFVIRAVDPSESRKPAKMVMPRKTGESEPGRYGYAATIARANVRKAQKLVGGFSQVLVEAEDPDAVVLNPFVEEAQQFQGAYRVTMTMSSRATKLGTKSQDGRAETVKYDVQALDDGGCNALGAGKERQGIRQTGDQQDQGQADLQVSGEGKQEIGDLIRRDQFHAFEFDHMETRVPPSIQDRVQAGKQFVREKQRLPDDEEAQCQHEVGQQPPIKVRAGSKSMKFWK